MGWLPPKKDTRLDDRDSLARLVRSIMEGEQDIRSHMQMQTNC